MFTRWIKNYSNLLIHWRWLFIFFGLLSGAVGSYYTVELYKNLRTDLEELLPTTARSVVDLKSVSERLESIDNMAVLVFSEDPNAAKQFVADLAKALEKVSPDLISSIEYKIDQEIQFFGKRKALYLDLSDIQQVRKYIEDRIAYEKLTYNPLTIFSGEHKPEPKLDFKAIQKKYASQSASYDRFPEGHYATPDGKKRVILLNMPGKGSGVDNMNRLKVAVTDAVTALNPKHYSPDLIVRYSGGVSITLEEHEALIADLGLSSVIVILLVGLALLLFFQSLAATTALMLSLFVGTFWTFGVAYVVVGYLNANSAFLGSIVIGNGINFGVIVLARYLEERKALKSLEDSIGIAVSQSLTPTLTAALAAALSYGSLSFTSFRGFNQFGVIGLIGMVLCWLSAFIVLPPLLAVIDPICAKNFARRAKKLAAKKTIDFSFADLFCKILTRYSKAICLMTAALTVLSVSLLPRYSPSILETDLTKMRNRKSAESGAAYLSKYVDEIFQRYLSPMVILTSTAENAQKIAALLKIESEKPENANMFGAIQTIQQFIPTDQTEKITEFKAIQALLPPQIMRLISPLEQKTLLEFLSPEAFKPIAASDLPILIRRKLSEKQGELGRMVAVEPALSGVTLDSSRIRRFVSILRNVADSVEPGAPLAGSTPITVDMYDAVAKDGPLATLYAFLAVLILVFILFRDLKTSSLILSALLLGMVWLAGLILGTGYKINFLNFIALPITFGIGVDYGVNIFSRFKQEGPESLIKVVRETGGAVTLCSFTTIVGYSSLLIANNGAFVSFGTLAVVGEITCLIAALISLPAFLLWLEQRSKKTSSQYKEHGSPTHETQSTFH